MQCDISLSVRPSASGSSTSARRDCRVNWRTRLTILIRVNGSGLPGWAEEVGNAMGKCGCAVSRDAMFPPTLTLTLTLSINTYLKYSNLTELMKNKYIVILPKCIAAEYLYKHRLSKPGRDGQGINIFTSVPSFDNMIKSLREKKDEECTIAIWAECPRKGVRDISPWTNEWISDIMIIHVPRVDGHPFYPLLDHPAS